jgi:hypothetical protein
VDVNQEIARLIDKWCERRALRELRILLQVWPLPNGFTDEWHALLEQLRHLRAMCRDDLQKHHEYDTVGALIGEITPHLYPSPKQESTESFVGRLFGAIFGKRQA